MKTCSIIGHRKIIITTLLKLKLEKIFTYLITEHSVTNFLFGSKSQFNDLCYDIITNLKQIYLNVNRIYIRAEYPKTCDSYEKYILKLYEQSYYFDENLNSSKLNYIKRNETLINKSDYCIFYYNPENQINSGTRMAYNYALKKHKNIINVF